MKGKDEKIIKISEIKIIHPVMQAVPATQPICDALVNNNSANEIDVTFDISPKNIMINNGWS